MHKFGGQKIKIKSGRIKYTCENCGLNAWAKPQITLVCGERQKILMSD